MNILVTGGAGYIGSHTIVELLNKDHQVVVIDNLANSSEESLKRVEQITGKAISFYQNDVQDRQTLQSIFDKHQIDSVIHFAGLKAVGESVAEPLLYYRNNLDSTLTLLEVMDQYNVRQLVFSSSATVYGDPETLPIPETAPRSTTNPYGATKLMIEQILEDTSKTNQNWCFTSLRYFNPVGAHKSGRIGEDPNGKPNNLLPYISQVAIGKLDGLSIYGNDYDTSDGTGVRDYIHVVDLAQAHVAALENIDHPNIYKSYNIGSGTGTSVLELVKAFEAASSKSVPYTFADRRPGDIASCYADPGLAQKELNWQTKLSIEEACQDSWRWQSQNPNGYK